MSLSICIPTFNRADFLRSLLQGVCSEIAFHRLDTKVVVVDNCSTDDTPNVVQEFEQKFSFLKGFRNGSNVGGIKNFYLAISSSETTHCWLCGDDSVMVPGSIKHISDVLVKYPESDFIFAAGNNQPKTQPQYLAKRYLERGRYFEIDNIGDFLGSVYIQDLGCISYLVVKKAAWQETNYLVMPSSFIYPQINSILEIMARPKCLVVYTHRLCLINAKANDDHNQWYLGLAPLSILVEWPWLRRRAESLGFRSKGEGIFKKDLFWQLHQLMIVIGFHPYYHKAYRDILLSQDSIFVALLFRISLFFAPVLRPFVRWLRSSRFNQGTDAGVSLSKLDYHELPNLQLQSPVNQINVSSAHGKCT